MTRRTSSEVLADKKAKFAAMKKRDTDRIAMKKVDADIAAYRKKRK